MNIEIERKFLVTRFPEEEIKNGALKIISVKHIDQTYLGLGKKDELRIRKLVDADSSEETFTFTFKKDKKESRLELEEYISAELYESILLGTKNVPLRKKRTTLHYNGYNIEIDEYDDFDLIVAEVEFQSVDEMRSFEPLEWFQQDVSGKKEYSNKYLWRLLQK
jgi:adenylate cyclase